MHVLAVESGTVDTGDEAVDLGQSPGDIVVLSAADTELQLLAKTFGGWAEANTPTLRLANVLALRHNYSVDLYIEKTLAHARLIVVRLLGGRAYWPYGLEALARLHRETGVQIAVLPGDDKPDASLRDASTVPADRLAHLWRCLVEGDAENARLFLAGCAALISGAPCPPAPKPLPRAGVYRTVSPDGEAEGRATVLFYRALVQAGDLAPVDALIETLAARRLATHALYVNALRDAESGSIVRDHFTNHPPDVVLNATAFASGGAQASGDGASDTLLGTNAPWLQVVFSSRAETDWASDIRGLGVRDVAMHVAMPEFDGRIFAGATAFKADVGRDAATEFALTRLAPHGERTARAADLATRWARLRTTPAGDKRVAIILANYPNRDSRMANGVGLSTPASVAATARHLRAAGFLADGFPATGDDLMATLRAGPTNRDTACRRSQATLPLDVYQSWFDGLPADARGALLDRWGPASADPFVRDGAFQLALHTFGNVVVGVQPARGYNIDPKATYHDPALIPPHGYLAFYLWLRDRFGAHAVIHFGKHGNLEWLPGKALALSASCWPDIALGGLPHIYPFIVNDPGEGAQAKRRSAAVIIDHMTPPMTRAESHGAMRELEGQLDEYAEAVSVDPKRALRLGPVILREAERIGLAEDLKLDPAAAEADRLQALDAALCDLKELQIRGGLHVFGQSLEGQERDEMLSALLRVPRGEGPDETSLQRALAADLDLGAFDPLDCDLGARWAGPRPHAIARASNEPWRTNGDTVERIELLALDVIAGRTGPPGPASAAVLGAATTEIAPALDACGPRETAALVAALSGRFVAPGPSGAPTRGRADVLPTGRNFYSLDSRALPTPTAWELGKRAADALVARYLQDHGDWPRAIVMSAWGTSNMRTGGDDLAQALSLMGARPKWEPSSRRVTGFEIMTPAELGRPRVDVTLRISGFFRDAFPQQIALIDSVVRAIAEREGEGAENPMAAAAVAEHARLQAAGLDGERAWRQATYRVFGSKPGAYGAGLQAMFDEDLWADERDLADAFLTWSQYAYGSDTHGATDRDGIERRLTAADAVLHNQDNREHDILDSDDYYQFAGGLAVAGRVLKGEALPVYHGDHARPERPVVRGLDEEIARVVRARATNPKWIGAMKAHGYKGAFELAATVDYLTAFAATTGAVRDHHFEAVHDAYLGNDETRAFLERANPDALADIARRLADAVDRGLWTPRRNSAYRDLKALLEEPAA